MRQQVHGEEEFPDKAQSRDCVKSCGQQEVSCALNEDNRRRPFNACKDGKRVVVKAPN
jgi:ubiquitin